MRGYDNSIITEEWIVAEEILNIISHVLSVEYNGS